MEAQMAISYFRSDHRTNAVYELRARRRKQREDREARKCEAARERRARSAQRASEITAIMKRCSNDRDRQKAAIDIANVLNDEEGDPIACENGQDRTAPNLSDLLRPVPNSIRHQPGLLYRVPRTEQVTFVLERKGKIPPALWKLLAPEIRILAVFRAAQARTPFSLFPDPAHEENPVRTAMLILRGARCCAAIIDSRESRCRHCGHVIAIPKSAQSGRRARVTINTSRRTAYSDQSGH
jgi:hypothetical protein